MRSGGEHCHPELAVELGPAIRSSPSGNTAILYLRLMSGGEHCHPTLAGTAADIKSNNPHLTGGNNGQKHKREQVSLARAKITSLAHTRLAVEPAYLVIKCPCPKPHLGVQNLTHFRARMPHLQTQRLAFTLRHVATLEWLVPRLFLPSGGSQRACAIEMTPSSSKYCPRNAQTRSALRLLTKGLHRWNGKFWSQFRNKFVSLFCCYIVMLAFERARRRTLLKRLFVELTLAQARLFPRAQARRFLRAQASAMPQKSRIQKIKNIN